MDVYIGKTDSSDPTQFSNDIAFKQTTYVSLNSRDFEFLADPEGYSVTVYVQAFDENANTFLSNTLSANFVESSSVY